MSFRNARRQMSNQVARTERNQMKLQKLRDQVRQSTQSFMARQHARLAWWQSAFRTPTLVGRFVSGFTSIWMAFLGLLGLSPRNRSTAGYGRGAVPGKVFMRGLLVEGLEPRQVMAADIEFDSLGTSSSLEGSASGGPLLGVLGDLSAATPAQRTISFTIANSSTETGDVTSNFGAGIATFEIPAANYAAYTTFDLQVASALGTAITIVDDRIVEGNEIFITTISGLGSELKLGDANKGGLAISSTLHQIIDNDTATVSFSAASSSVAETTASQNVNVKLNLTTTGTGLQSIESGVTVDISQTSGSAASGIDYSFPGTPMVSFPGGSGPGASVNVALAITNDLFVEGSETAGLKLGVPTGVATADPGLHTLTITDDDSATVGIAATKSVTEAGGAQDVVVTLTLGGTGTGSAELGTAISVDVTDAGGGTATTVADYASIGIQTLTFGIGAKSLDTKNATVTPVSDGDLEGNEALNLKLGNLTVLSGVTLGNAASVVTITDDETATATIEATGSLTEDVSADTPPNVLLAVTGTKSVGTFQLGAGVSVDVNLLAVAGSALAADYALSPTKVTFTGATTAIPAPVAPVNDGLLEGNEQFALNISSVTATGPTTTPSTATGGASSSTVTIVDDESAEVGFQAGKATGSESALTFGSVPLQITINGTNSGGPVALGSGVTIALPLSAVAITATPVVDFSLNLLSGITPIPSGTVSGATAAVPINPVNDALLEGTESATIVLGTPVASGPGITAPVVSAGLSTSDFDITDDESATISIAGGSVTEVGGAQNTATVTLNIVPGVGSSGTPALSPAVTITALVTDTPVTAANPADYAFTNGSVTFAPGALSGATDTATVTPVNDFLYEGTENLKVDLGSLSISGLTAATVKAALGTNSANVNILDDEQASIGFSLATSQTHEKLVQPHKVDAKLTITGSGSGTPTLAIPVSASADNTGGTAGEPSDYSFAVQSASFGAGKVSGDVVQLNLTAVDDLVPEGMETAVLTLTSPTGGATVGSFSSHTVEIHDRLVTIKANDTNPIEDAVSNSQFEVKIDTPSLTDTEVIFTVSGTADLGPNATDDYKFGPQVKGTGPSYTVTIPAGASTTVFDIDVTDDTLFDPNETIVMTVTATNPGSPIILPGTPNSATMTIKDNETAPNLSISGKTDGAEGTPTVGSNGKFTVAISSGLDSFGTAVFALSGGATETTDYSFSSSVGTATVNGAKTSLTISNIPINTLAFDINVNVVHEGLIVEETETVSLTPDSFASGSATKSATVLNITDDDAARVSIGNGTGDGLDVTVNENGANVNVVFELRDVNTPFGLMTSSTDTTLTLSKTQDADTNYGSDYVLYSNIDTLVAPNLAANNTLGSAQSLNGARWNIAPGTSVVSAASVPHVTISGTADGTFEYYSFTLLEPSIVNIDVDISNSVTAAAGNDSFIVLWNAAGAVQASNNDGAAEGGFLNTDSALNTATLPAGTYTVGLARNGVTFNTTGFTSAAGTTALASGTPFSLHISTTSPQSAEPTQVLIRANNQTATIIFNPIDENGGLLEDDEFVEYTIASKVSDPQITIDTEVANTKDNNNFKININETTTGNVRIQGTAANPFPSGLGADRLNAAEPGTNGKFLVTMSSPADRAVVVPFRINPASIAKLNDDFTFGGSVSGTGTGLDPFRITLGIGATTAVIDIIVANDSIVEIDEILTLDLLDTPDVPLTIDNQDLVGPDGDAQLTIGSPGSESILIKDEDLAVINVNSSTDKAFEGGTDGVFTIFLSKGQDDGKGGIDAILPTASNSITASTDTVVTYEIVFPATEAGATDYDQTKLPLTGTVTIPANATSTTLIVDALPDLLNESPEKVVLKILSISKGDSNIVINNKGGDQDTVFIQDANTTTVTIKATDSIGAESPDNNAVFTVFLNGGTITPAAAITVTYSISGTATDALDYTGLSGSVVIPAGQTSATILIDVQNDPIVEPTETVILTLTGVSGAPSGVDVVLDTTPANLTDTATIDSSDDKGTVSIDVGASDLIAQEGTNSGFFVVKLSAPSSTGVLVNYKLESVAPLFADATPGSDYKALSGSVFVQPNQTTASVLVEVIDDAVTGEPDEFVAIKLTGYGSPDYSDGAPISASVKILPDQQVSVAKFDDATEGVDTGSFVVSMTTPSTEDTIISFKLTGKAVEGSDFANTTKSVTITKGNTTALVTIDPTVVGNDFVLEATEDVQIELLAITNVAPNASSDITVDSKNSKASLNIFDEDKAYVTIAATDGKEGSSNGAFTLTLRDINGNPTTADSDIQVNFDGATGTAGVPGDYNPAMPSKATILAGKSSAVVDVIVTNDSVVEVTETVTLPFAAVNPIDPLNGNNARVTIASFQGPNLVFQQTPGGYSGTEDIYFEQAAPTVNTEGAGLFSNTDSLLLPAFTQQHSLLKFGAIFGSGLIPFGSKIGSAVLDLWTPSVFAAGSPTDGDISLHQMLANWNESLTWDTSDAFGDFIEGIQTGTDASIVGVPFTLADQAFATTINKIGVTGVVQNWSNGQANFGWAILPGDTVNGTRVFDSEFGNAALRPRLNVTLSTSATVNILDDDVATLAINTSKTVSATEDVTNGVVTVELNKTVPAGYSVNVNYTVGGGGSALAGSDYKAKTGSVVIPGGSFTSTFDVEVLMDSLIEGPEDVKVSIDSFTVTGPDPVVAAGLASLVNFGTKTQLVPIIDNDTAAVSVTTQVSGDENPALPTVGKTNPVFRISLSPSTSTTDTTVEYTLSGQATAGDDYSGATTGIATIKAGSLFTDITIDLIDDTINESTESLTITLGKISGNAGILPGSMTITDQIEDDDVLTADIEATDKIALENPNSNTGNFKISIGASDKATSVPFTIGGGTAQNPTLPLIFPASSVSGPDYGLTASPTVTFITATTGTVTFPASKTAQSANIVVTAVQDYIPVGVGEALTETVLITLGTPTGGNGPIGGNGDVDTVNITDEDFSVTIEKTDSPAREDGPPISGFNGQFTVTIANPTPIGVPVTVPFTIVNGAALGVATYGADYTVNGAGVTVLTTTPGSVTGTVVIPGGQTQAVITVDVEADSLVEGTELVDITIGTPSLPSDSKGLAKLGAKVNAVESITDNDVGQVSIGVIEDIDGIGPDQVGIGELNATPPQNDGLFRFSLDKKVEYVDTVVTFEIDSKLTTATLTKDYNLVGALGGPTYTVTIGKGTSSTDVLLDVLGDLEIEGSEDVVLKILTVTSKGMSVSTDGSKDTAKATIADDDAATISILAIDADAREPSNPGIFQVSFPAGVTSKTNTVVTYTTAGTANTGTIANTDYTPLSGTVTILAGQSTASISVVTLDDSVVEADETVIVTLDAKTSNASIGASGKDTVIIDSEDTSVVSILSKTDGAEDSTAATLTVSMTNIADVAITIPLDDKLVGSATGKGTDFTLPASITIPAGQTSATINISVTSDNLVEGTENLTVGLLAPTGVYLPPDVTSSASTVSINIADNDTNVLQISSPTVTEGDSGTKTLTFQVTSPSAVAGAFTVAYSVTGGTAKTGVVALPDLADFTGGSGTLSFTGAAGGTSTFSVTVNGDTIVEANETILITLGTVTATPAVVAQITSGAVGTGTITNDDTATFTVTPVAAAAEGAPVSFTLVSDKLIDIPINLSINYSGGDATGASFAPVYSYKFGEDYDNQTDTATLPAFTTSIATLSVVATNQDLIVEGLQATPPGTFGFETFNAVTAVTTSGRSINTIANAVGQINDSSDSAVLTVTSKKSAGDDDASEPGAGKGDGLFTFELNNPVQAPVVISYTYKIAGAAGDPNGDLKAPLSGTITIPGSTTSANNTVTLKIEAFDDLILEDDELVELTITGVSTDPNVSFTNTPANQVVNLQDDDTALITITATDNVAQEPDTTPNAGTATYTVSLTKVSDTPTTISLITDSLDPIPGTTASPSDYTGLPAFVTIPAGKLSTTFTITAVDDVLNEPDEFLVVKLVPGSIFGNADITVGSPASDKITIKDDGDSLFLNITKVRDGSEPGIDAADEGQFVVQLVDALGNPAVVPLNSTTAKQGIQVFYSVTGGTASNPGDYNAPTGVLSIKEGNSSGLISIDVTDDQLVESTESVEITLTGIQDAGGAITALPGTGEKIAVGAGKSSLDIKDDDVAKFTINDATVNENAGTVTLTVSLDNELDIASTVDIKFTDFNATGGGVDYDSTAKSVAFGANDKAPKSFTVAITPDLLVEGPEVFFSTLSSATLFGGRSVTFGVGSVLILDSSLPVLQIQEVKVGSTTWTPAFQNVVDPTGPVGRKGYAIPAGAAQDDTLPWFGIDRLYVKVTEDLDLTTLNASNIILQGVNGTPSINFASPDFGYNAASKILTLPLNGTIQNDRLRLTIKDGVKSAAGAILDGEWNNNIQTGNSGNGTAGTTFEYRFNVLPGDATHSTVTALPVTPGTVVTDNLDLSAVFASVFTATNAATIFRDVNGSGVVDNLDLSAIFSVIFTTLPGSLPGTLSSRGSNGTPLVGGLGSTSSKTVPVSDTVEEKDAGLKVDESSLLKNSFVSSVDAVFGAPKVDQDESIEGSKLSLNLFDEVLTELEDDFLM